MSEAVEDSMVWAVEDPGEVGIGSEGPDEALRESLEDSLASGVSRLHNVRWQRHK